MSQQIGGYRPATATGLPTGQPTTQVARDEATDVGRTAADAGRQVAGTAAEQAADVAQEVKTQARDLVGEARGQVQQQARDGQQKATDGIRALVQELREMADGGQQAGPVSEIARQAADRGDRLADWLGEREPGDLVEEVRSFARRRPGAFVLGAAVAGVVVGRLTRGAVDAARVDPGPAPLPAYGSGYPRPPAAPLPYDGPTGPGVPPSGLPPVAPRPAVPYDTLTPPQEYAPPSSYGVRPLEHLAAAPPPPESAQPARDLDPFATPAEPAGRHAPGTGGEYVDEIERAAGDRRAAGSEDLDDPYRPGTGELR
jgi:hypothetical protein